MKIFVKAVEVTDIEGIDTTDVYDAVREYVAKLNGISKHEVFIGEPYDPVYPTDKGEEWMGFKVHPLYPPNVAITPSYRYWRTHKEPL